MPPILNELGNYGMLGLLMVAVVYITILIIKKLPDRKENGYSKTLQAVSDTLIAHNERASENHKAILVHFANVMHDHEKMMDSIMKIIMSIIKMEKKLVFGLVQL
jgi:hypothetical protein